MRELGQELPYTTTVHIDKYEEGEKLISIHATIFARRTGDETQEEITATLARYYESSSFIQVAPSPPRLKDIVGTNNAILSVNTDDSAIVVNCVLDNLVKGAAGGAIQWANRLLGWPQDEGLVVAPPGWV